MAQLNTSFTVKESPNEGHKKPLNKKFPGPSPIASTLLTPEKEEDLPIHFKDRQGRT